MLCYSVGDKVRLTTNTLFVEQGQVGVVVEPIKGQTPPQLFPNRVQFPDGQSTRTVWCGTDELELVVDDAGPATDNPVADGSRDYGPTSGPEDRDAADTAQAGSPVWQEDLCTTQAAAHLAGDFTSGPPSLDPCPCLTDGPCSVDWDGSPKDEPWTESWEWDGLSQFEEDVVRIFVDAQELLLKKHKDYGPKNISQSPGGALNGLRVRMHDKLARLNHLVDKGQEPQVLDESLKDTLTDLANYAIIGIMVLEGTWPSE